MSRPLSASLVLTALGAALAGWGSCGGGSYNCSYVCGETEGQGTMENVSASSAESAEAACKSAVPNSCLTPQCSCYDPQAQ